MAGNPPYFDNYQWPASGGIRVPNEVFGSKGFGNPGATMALKRESSLNVATLIAQRGPSPVALTAAETQSSVFTFTNAAAAAAFELPTVIPGAVYVLRNASGQSITFRVKGGTGVTVATGYTQIVVSNTLAGDVTPAAAAVAG